MAIVWNLGLQRLQALEDGDRLALAHLHDRLAPRVRASAGRAAPLGLGLHAQRAHVDHVHVEQRLHGLPDLGLVRVAVHAKGVAVGGGEHVALLRHDGTDQDVRGLHQAALLEAARAASCWSEGSETTTEAAPSRSLTPTSSTARTDTRARLRKERAAASSSGASTTRVGRAWPHSCRSSRAWRVFGSEKADASRIATEPRSACRERALRSAARCSLRLTLNVYARGWGPKAVPPPVHSGERLEPARALPVPFWRHGLAPPPETSARVRVAAVPLRRAACSARTLWWTSAPRKRAPNAVSSSFTLRPAPSRGARLED